MNIQDRLRVVNALLIVAALVTIGVLYFTWTCR